jgi:hypothetical protein
MNAAVIAEAPGSQDEDWIEIVDQLSIAESLARGGAEAAWRMDRPLTLIHLLELRAAVVAAVRAYKRMSGAPA